MSPPRDKAATLELAPDTPTPQDLPPCIEDALERETVVLTRMELFMLRGLCNEEHRTWTELAERVRARVCNSGLVQACMDRADEALELAHKLETPSAPPGVAAALDGLEQLARDHLDMVERTRAVFKASGLVR